MNNLLQRIRDWYIISVREPLRQIRIPELDSASGYYRGISHL